MIPDRGSCHPDLITEKAKWRDPPPSHWKEVLRTVRNYRFELFLTHLCLWTITPAPTKCQSLLLREQPVNKDKTKLRLLPRSPYYTLLLNSCHSSNSPRKEIKSYLCNFQLPSKEIRNEIQLCHWSLFFKDQNRLVYEITTDHNVSGIAYSLY